MSKSLMTFAILAFSLFALIIGGCPSSDSCKPISHAGSYCQEGILYWVDSCGDFEEINAQCSCGCSDDHQSCKQPCGCTPSCSGKCCGDDGCGDSCPNNCGASQTCNQATCQCEGSCQPQTCGDRGYECGSWPNGDGCGGSLNCGNCPAGEECSASGQCIPVGCPNGQALCDGMCVDSTEDARYCGSCTTTCAAGQVCENSQCQTAPNCSQTPCTGMAYCDLASGQCLPGCLADNQCPSRDEVCDTYTHDCDCQAGMHRCTGVCYSDSDVNHCGVSCQVCQMDPLGVTSCTGGQCVTNCNNDHELCDSGCALCPTSGATGFGCAGSECVATTCHNGYLLCDGACADCPSGGVTSTACNGGQCVATACYNGYELCAGACDQCPTTGVANTGCSGAECVATSCQTGYSLCEGECALCPTGANILQTGCAGDQCVATECAVEYYPWDGGCTAWLSEQVDSGDQVGWSAQLDIGPNGNPQIAYCDAGNRDLKMARLPSAGGAWNVEVLDSTNNTGLSPSLVVDSQNQAHVIYYDLTDHELMYARYNSSTSQWTIESVVYAGGSFINSSMDLDSSGQPHVCFYDRSDEAFYYIKRTSSGWGNKILIDNTGWVYLDDVPCSLAVGSNNQPRVLYRNWDDDGNSWQKLATYTGSSWQMDVLLTQSTVVLPRSLVLDSNDDPHILYFNHSSYRLVYGHKQGNSWDYSTLVSDIYLDENSAAFQLRLDSNEQAHVVWKNYNPYYGRLEGGSWFISQVNDDGAEDISFDLDANDRPHFTIYDDGYPDRLNYLH